MNAHRLSHAALALALCLGLLFNGLRLPGGSGQAEAASVLMISRPRVSDVVNRKTEKFTIDTLIDLLGRIGKPVRLSVDNRS